MPLQAAGLMQVHVCGRQSFLDVYGVADAVGSSSCDRYATCEFSVVFVLDFAYVAKKVLGDFLFFLVSPRLS